MRIMRSLLIVLTAAFWANAQELRVTSIIIRPEWPHFNYVTLGGDNISSTPIGGEFDPGWDRCRPCQIGTQIPLSINRTQNTAPGPIELRGPTTLNIAGTVYNWTVGWLEMTYNVPFAQIIMTDNRRNMRFAREDTASVRIRLWESENSFPNAAPILDKSLQMTCTAYLNAKRAPDYELTPGSHRYASRSYEWQCVLPQAS